MNDVVALVLAAGKGTRMKSSRAKVLHPLLGRPLIAYPVAACRQAGVERVVAVVGHQAPEVAEALEGFGVALAFQEEQRGTGHAVLCARDAADTGRGVALVLCGDVPLIRPETLSALLATHRQARARVTVLSVELADPAGYGRLVRDRRGRLQRIVEEKDAPASERAIREVNTGTYAVELPWVWEALEGVGADNSQGEYYLTDVVEAAARDGRATSLRVEDPAEVLGINSRTHLAEATRLLRGRINERWMEAGVTLEDPATTWIEPGVTLAPDVTLGPGCRLTGATQVETGARLDQGVVAHDAVIGAGAHVKPYCVLSDARLGPGVQVGPFAHLRPGAVLEEGARVGNFVEMKKAVLGRGSKANHLTYLGDTTVGEGANIGAGTITCNYDGVHKHPTVIGDGAFIGSNASLVAPVEIGPGATVAAGSTVTQDVPPEALGVGRARQRNVSDWKRKRSLLSK
ncbi:MAG: bifunctional UDP-N-acetylglucosamine diphosphorylase/glucosamine-1-phosphate N-acetyltransferase GlmU [Deferrisomatales bacterium]